MGPLIVLMWKHMVVRKRRFIHTPIEFISPIIFFILLSAFKDFFTGGGDGTETRRSFVDSYTETFPISDVRSPTRILYTPKSNLTRKLMAEVAKRISKSDHTLKELDHSPLPHEIGYAAYNNESTALRFSKHMRGSSAIVIFENLNESWPSKLEYTIRMRGQFMPNDYKPNSTKRRQRYFGEMYEPFMSLQWAIDSSYLQLKTGKNITQRVHLQEFPSTRFETEHSSLAMIIQMLDATCPLALLIMFVFFVTKLMNEKNTGVQEMIKMVGVSNNQLGISYFLNVLPGGIIYSVFGSIIVKATSKPLIPNSDGMILCIALFLHFMTVVALAFAFSYIFNSNQFVTTVTVFAYLMFWLPYRIVSNVAESTRADYKMILGILPHLPMGWVWHEILAREKNGHGVTSDNFAENEGDENGSVLQAYIYMIIQTALFFALSWYFALVQPGPYGIPLPWNFLCSRKKKATEDSSDPMEEELVDTERDPQFFEPPPDVPAGIKVINVTKEFNNKQRALSNVSFEALKGEITVLLGHNGAGKTTLMSIITGLATATSGTILVNGKDCRKHRSEVRREIGLCPQHNLFFNDLSVLEHVMFFTMMKGIPYKKAKESSKELLAHLNLTNRMNMKTDQLSGGMKRRVQLACALAGGAHVLILDEPTSGLDVETRRELWDLLLSLRGERTVLLTTHFMEEADALGDRVCALHKGTVRCHATTMFLKRAIGTGYRLSFTTTGAPNEPAITSTIRASVPDAFVKELTLYAISYNLPAKDADRFPRLFSDLESRRHDLGIETIGVGRSTLDEVFLRLCSDVDTSFTQEDVEEAGPPTIFEKVKGIQLYKRQFLLLIKRQWKFNIHKKILFIFFHIIGTIVGVFVITYAMNMTAEEEAGHKNVALDLGLYDKMPLKRALYKMPNDTIMKALRTQYKKVDFEQVPDILGTVLRSAREDNLEYKKYLVGVEMNDTDAKVLYTTTVRHAAPVALNLLSNILAEQMMTKSDGRSITTYNDPIQKYYTPPVAFANIQPKDSLILLTWGAFMGFMLFVIVSCHAALPARERVTGTRHIHIMSGCSPSLYWIATLTYNFVLTLLIVIMPAIISAFIFVQEPGVDQTGFFGCLFILMVLGTLAFHIFCYLISTVLSENPTMLLLFVITLCFGVITPASHYGLSDVVSPITEFTLTLFWVLLASHTMTHGFLKTVNVAHVNAVCSLNRKQCGTTPVIIDEDDYTCCATTGDMFSYYSGKKTAGLNIVMLIVQFAVYWILLMLVERGALDRLWERIVNMRYKTPVHRYNDPVVIAEASYVDEAIKQPKDQINEALLAHNLHKKFPKIIGKSIFAVKGTSFSVKRGECFGLLGVNGAGKSTTFKMLTAEIQPTRGELYADKHFKKNDRFEYMRSLSYCPQFSGLDDFMTGRENLTLVLTLRGFNDQDVKAQTESWIEVVGLERHADKKVSAYSGGCSRRLAAAAALAQDTAAALLDEPTAGVDVAARRRVWRALKKALREGRSIIIASHSMDEMEALSDRICIMAGGEIGALDAPGALRARHAAGHAVLFRLKHKPEDMNAWDEVERFKDELEKRLNCTLKDEHHTMLHYHINDTMRYSELFASIESLKQAFPHLLEDYSVSETTLEEVFLTFAREPPAASGPSTV